MSRSWRPFFHSAIGPTLLLLIYIGFFWKLTLTRQYTWLESPDMAYQIMPWFQVEARAFHEHTFPLWDPYEWGGQSLIGQAQPGAAYPLNWIVWALPLKEGFISQIYLHWYFVLIHYLGGLFCYLLCRDLKLGLVASIMGGCAFGMSGWMGTTDWPQMLNGAVWAPLMFLFLLRAVRVGGKTRHAALAGACLGCALLSGHDQIPIFIGLAAGGVFVCLWVIYSKQGRSIHAFLKTGLFGLFTFLVGGLQTLPALEYGRLSLRWVSAANPVDWKTPVPYSVHEMLSLSPSALLGIAIPGIWGHSLPYLGWALLALAFYGLATRWQDRAVRIFAAVGLGGVLLSLGQNNIFHGLLYATVPLIEKARNPSMAVFLFDFAAAVLAAFGIEQIHCQARSFAALRSIHRLLYAAAAILAVFALAKIAFANLPGLDAEALSLAALSAFLAAAIFHALRFLRISGRIASLLLLALALYELGNFTTAHYARRDKPDGIVKKLYRNEDVAAFLRSRPEPVRIGIDMHAIPYNFGDWYGIDAIEEYTASIPVRTQRVVFEYWAQMLFAQNYSIGPKLPHYGGSLVFTGQSGLQVYRDANAFPRVWSVHRVTLISSDDEIASRMFAARAGMRSEVFLTARTPPQVESCSTPDTVHLVSRSNNRLSVDAEMTCRGMLIVSEAYAPGWRAYVDQNATPIWPAYTFLRGVIVPPGHHRIEMVYRPASVILGAIATSLGLLAAALLLFSTPSFKH